MSKSIFGYQLTKALDARQLTVKDLSDRLHYPISTLYSWISGVHNIRMSDLVRISTYLGVTIDFLAGVKPTPDLSRWIPVEEALPEEGKTVAVNVIVEGDIPGSPAFRGVATCTYENGQWENFHGFQVTSWTPLPDIPERE